MPKQTKKVTIELTKDEFTILRFVFTNLSGEPLKGIYELGDDVPWDPYATLGTLRMKISRLKWGAPKSRS